MSASATSPTRGGLTTGLEKVAETLHCPLCLDFYKDPVALTCQHNFCRDCIKKVVPRRVSAAYSLECPLCRKLMVLSCRDGVDNIPKNFERESIVETFQVAEREHARSVRSLRESAEESLTNDLVKQIDNIHYSQEQENEQMRHSGERDAQPLSDNVFFSQTHSGVDTGIQEEGTALSVHAPFQQEDCSSTPQQQQQQQQHLRQLQQEQYILQLKLEQEDALESAKNRLQQPQEPDWRQQQTDRWNELQPPVEAEHQSVKQSISLPWNVQPQPYQYPPTLKQSQSLPYPLMTTNESYPYPSTSSESYGYPSYPYPHQEKATISQPSLSQSKETSCSECNFPASAHCQDCLRFFCWQCLQDLHNPTRGLYAGHKVTELTACIIQSESGASCSPVSTHGSSVSTPKQDSTFTLNTAMASLNVAGELASMGVSKQTYKIPYYCDINAMGPGKKITVFGQPAKNCKRFHINFQLNRKSKTGDLALHFNPRFNPVMVVRNSRIKGRYGSEEKSAPQFPFMVGRPFKLEFICLLDKFEVRVDNQYFISYKHRIHDLTSIKVFVIAGDVEISSVLGCA